MKQRREVQAMATTTTSTLTSEAYDIISCFYDGVEDVVYRLAETVARARTGVAPGRPVKIEAEDVRIAGYRVVCALLKFVDREDIPEEMLEAIKDIPEEALQEIGDCLGSK
jgi:hypothetical protein